MSRRWIKRNIIVVSLVALIALVTLAYNFFEDHKFAIENTYDDFNYEPGPTYIGHYPESRTGYYQFDPQTILTSLNRGKANLFTPLLVDPNTLDFYYPNIAWTQSDFLRVASALSQRIWNEPLDLDSWNVYIILAAGECSNHFSGFDDFGITYYKTINTGWDMTYTARHIDLMPYQGVAEWEGNGDFSTPFIFGWINIELTRFKITAEQAVQIADKNGGKATRLNRGSNCKVYVGTDLAHRDTEGDWIIDYGGIAPSYAINPFTGEFLSAK